jgi:nuclear mRNA export protein PCID2/THP1
MMLKTSMALSEQLARLTMRLSRRPDLTRRLQSGGDEDSRKSIAEASAEIIQKILTTCLTDRSSGRYSKPEGKKVGIYMFANLVLKLLFAVGCPLDGGHRCRRRMRRTHGDDMD